MCKNDTFYASKVPLKSDLNTPKIDVFGIFVHVSPTGIHRPPAKRAKMVENGHFCVSEHNVRMTLFVNFFVCALFEKRHVNFLCTCMKNNFTLSNMHVNFSCHTSSRAIDRHDNFLWCTLSNMHVNFRWHTSSTRVQTCDNFFRSTWKKFFKSRFIFL